MTTSQRPGRMRKLSRAEIAETPGLDAAAAQEYSARNTPGLHDRHEYDLLRVEWIRPSPRNPRKHFDEAGLQELADSIRQVGLLEPVVVRPAADSSSEAPRFELIAGERRWRAAKLASLADLPAIIRRDVDDALQLRLALLENLQRQDLDPLEEADGYRQLQELGMTQKAIAEAVHRSQPSIANAVRLLKLPESVQAMIRAGKLSSAHGRALLRYESVPQVLGHIAAAAVEERWTSQELEQDRLLDAWEVRQRIAREGKVAYVPIREHSDYRPDNNTRVPHPFVDELCRKACPFNAYRKLPEGELCFKPQHYEELAGAVKEAAQKAAAKERDRIKATAVKSAAIEVAPAPPPPTRPDGRLSAEEEQRRAVPAQAGLPRLQDLPGSVVKLDLASAPYPCQDRVCSCFGQALDGRGQPMFVCTKGRRHQQLLDEYDRQRVGQNKLRLEQAERTKDKILAGLEMIGSREAAILAAIVVKAGARYGYSDSLVDPDAIRRASTRVAGGPGKYFEAYSFHYHLDEPKRSSMELLASQDAAAVWKFALEAVLIGELHGYYASGGTANLARWYFGERIPAYLAPGWRPPRESASTAETTPSATVMSVADERLAEEIAAEQERLEAEYAAAQPHTDVCQREGCGHSQAKHYDGNGGRGHESTACKRGCGCTEFLAAAAARRETEYAAAGGA